MFSGRVVALGSAARRGTIASAFAVAAILVLPAVAIAGSIGSALGTVSNCAFGFDTVQMSSSGPSYTVPAGGGFITAWSMQGGAATDVGPAGLEVWRPTATAGSYTLVGTSPLTSMTPSVMNNFNLATPIAVQAGDLIGLRLEGPSMCAMVTGNLSDVFGSASGTTPAVGATQAFASNSSTELNVAATVSATAGSGGGGGGGTPGCDTTGDSNADNNCEQPAPCGSAESSHSRACVQRDGSDGVPAAAAGAPASTETKPAPEHPAQQPSSPETKPPTTEHPAEAPASSETKPATTEHDAAKPAVTTTTHKVKAARGKRHAG
jgi:hypothetical protein